MSHELRTGADTRLPRLRLRVSQLSLLALGALNLSIYLVGAPAYYAQLFPSNHACFQDCLTPANIVALHALGIPITAYADYWLTLNLSFAVTYFAVAALIFWRKSNDRMALLTCFFLVALGGSFPDIPAALAAVHPTWRLPVTLVSEDVLGFPLLVFFFFLFPNGRFVPRWTRWVAMGFAILFVPVAFFPGNVPSPLLLPLPVVLFGSLVYGQVYRYRHASTTKERQQTKWIVFGTAVALLGFLLLGVLLPNLLKAFFSLQNVEPLSLIILETSIYFLLLLVPFSLAIAILHYRLWDVDAIINKTLVYGGLSGILAVVYIGGIVGFQALSQVIFHQNSDVAIVISTLLTVALFQPLRHRIQASIDRRFYRRKYDAQKTLATFSDTLRQQVDLTRLSEQVLAVVQETVQPDQVWFWLRESKRRPRDLVQGLEPLGQVHTTPVQENHSGLAQ
jgi:hypothetical protein